ncbi:MAG: hypothetical protein V4787_01235 [Pseudomonadota bacterium]
MRPLLASALLACCLSLSGCAGGLLQPASPARDAQAPALAPQSALQSIAPGRTTREDLARTMGKAIVVHFDSGNEVWVYRWMGRSKDTRTDTELVVLLGPDGVVKKVRVRPAYA